MPDIHIHRTHHLGFETARQIGYAWAEKVEKKFDMDCTYEEGDTQDTLHFSRTGVKGTLLVDAQQFELKAELGFLLGAFKDRIEAEISEKLDTLLQAPPPVARKAPAAASRAGGEEHISAAKPAARGA